MENTIDVSELDKAKEIIAKAERLNEEKAAKIYEDAIKEINNLGYNIIPEGTFSGNYINITIKLIKI